MITFLEHDRKNHILSREAKGEGLFNLAKKSDECLETLKLLIIYEDEAATKDKISPNDIEWALTIAKKNKNHDIYHFLLNKYHKLIKSNETNNAKNIVTEYFLSQPQDTAIEPETFAHSVEDEHQFLSFSGSLKKSGKLNVFLTHSEEAFKLSSSTSRIS